MKVSATGNRLKAVQNGFARPHHAPPHWADP